MAATRTRFPLVRIARILLAATLLLIGIGVVGYAEHGPIDPPNGKNLGWWGQSPDVVGTDLEFLRRDGRTYALVASIGVGFRIFDVTDREHPQLVGAYASPGYQNDIQVRGNIAILSSDEPPYVGDEHHPVCPACALFEGIEIVDITNLALPVKLSDLRIDGGAHNATVHGATVYVSNISARSMDVINIRDPRNPQIVRRIAEEAGCAESPYPCRVIRAGETDWDPHDVTVATIPNNGTRLYVAAIEGTFILDATRALSPTVLSKIRNGNPDSYANIEISHQADPSFDGKYLVVTDERGGGVSEIGCPGGGMHVYDISNERAPRKVGVYFAPAEEQTGNCTVHVFRFLPRSYTLVTAWYSAGTWVIDMSRRTPLNSDELDNTAVNTGQKTTWGRTLGFAIMPGANTWAAKSPGLTPDGRLFMYTDDIVRGMDVFEYLGPLPGIRMADHSGHSH